MKYEPVMGLEIHTQLNTKSKMFCSCSADYFMDEPNTHVCPICLGLPGALPKPNKLSIEKVITFGLALNCKISKKSKFDRKNYFYPDIPKGYQISQFDQPLCEDGYVELSSNNIAITRIHLEEDTAKTIYSHKGSLVDFNKSGTSLMELVTEPDFRTSKELYEFAKKMQQVLEYTNVSDANIQKGQIRFELNISLRPKGEQALPSYKVEVKNIGSITFLKKAAEYEILRQTKILDRGEIPIQETRGFNDNNGKTVSQRTKEDSEDYRYFPEPDIPPLYISKEWVKEIESKLPELPDTKLTRIKKMYGLKQEQATIVCQTLLNADYFEETCKHLGKDNFTLVGNWFTVELIGAINSLGTRIEDIKLCPKGFSKILGYLFDNKINNQTAKDLIKRSLSEDIDIDQIINEEGLRQMSDNNMIEKIVIQVMNENPKVVEDIKTNDNARAYLVGQVMSKTKGKANPKLVMEIINEKIK